MMTAEDVLQVLDCLDSAGVHVWLDGGWGVDALLGEETRAHGDLDAVMRGDQVETAVSALVSLGYETSEDFRPTRLVLTAPGDRKIDFHPIVLDGEGNGRQLGAGPAGSDAIYPAAGLCGEGTVSGRPVSCLTPELLVLHHCGYEPAPKDRHNVRRLSERFRIPLPEVYR